MDHREPQSAPRGLLRTRDQACAAAFVAVGMAVVLSCWIWAGGPRGRLVDLENARMVAYRFSLDINSAPWPEWTLLPGVGETLARRIVESRQGNGPFIQLEDLLSVKGIGPKKLEAMRPYLQPLPAPLDPRLAVEVTRIPKP